MEGGGRRYPRIARVNELLREVIAEHLETDLDDSRAALITITGVESEPDLRNATVYYSALDEQLASATLEQHRVQLQAAINAESRLKRTPHLHFRVDPAVEAGRAVEEILRNLEHEDH